MTSFIQVPVKAIRELTSSQLDLFEPARCSRCNTLPAPYFETHPLKYRAGFMRNRTFSRKFQTVISFRLRLPLCENCYRKNFMEVPETMDRDKTSLGLAARWRSFGIILASLFTGASFILLMNVVNLPTSFAGGKSLWLSLITIAAALYALTFGAVALKNRQLKQQLLADKYDLKLHRAAVEATMQAETPEPDDVAVTVGLENDSWAPDCAQKFGFKVQNKDTQTKKDDVQ
jgi:hypothetical protein